MGSSLTRAKTKKNKCVSYSRFSRVNERDNMNLVITHWLRLYGLESHRYMNDIIMNYLYQYKFERYKKLKVLKYKCQNDYYKHEYDYMVKWLLVGDLKVGKSSI